MRLFTQPVTSVYTSFHKDLNLPFFSLTKNTFTVTSFLNSLFLMRLKKKINDFTFKCTFSLKLFVFLGFFLEIECISFGKNTMGSNLPYSAT